MVSLSIEGVQIKHCTKHTHNEGVLDATLTPYIVMNKGLVLWTRHNIKLLKNGYRVNPANLRD